MAVQLVDVLSWCVGGWIESDKLSTHHKVLHEGQPISIKRCLPTSLPNHHTSLHRLRIAQPFSEARHVVRWVCRRRQRPIQCRHIEAAHKGTRLVELDRQEER